MTWAGVCLGPPTAGNSPAIFLWGGVVMGKTLSIFIDESGDVGFIKDASKYYIITFVIHNQSDDIKNNIEKIKNYPTFHAGPIIRREYPLDNIPKDWVEEAYLKLENRCKNKFMDIIFNKNHEEQRKFLNELGITDIEVTESNGFNYYENEKMYNTILDKYDEKEIEHLLDNYIEKNKNDKEEEYE